MKLKAEKVFPRVLNGNVGDICPRGSFSCELGDDPMRKLLGIRREDKNEWERRVPLTPDDVRKLSDKHGITFYIQPSAIRVFPDEAFREAGAVVQDDLSSCSVVIGVKEMPSDFFLPGKTYIFFSHTIKGQDYNMGMLKSLVHLKCNLIDYELITDRNGERLVFFGLHAGLAGMVNGLWALGQRFKEEGISTPFEEIHQVKNYGSLKEAEEAIEQVGRKIEKKGLPAKLTPMIVGFSGHGNASQGAQAIFDKLPHKTIEPGELSSLARSEKADGTVLYKVVFKAEHIVEPIDPDQVFDHQDYHQHPQKYRSIFRRYLSDLTYLVNCIFWTADYPRLVTKADIKELFSTGKPKLRGIADISCDVGGSVECLLKCTDPGNPTYVYLPEEDTIVDGFSGHGLVIVAEDTLPSEISLESSTYFSSVLHNFIPDLVSCDFSKEYDQLLLPEPLKKALILHKGKFTEKYRYMEAF